MGTYEEVDKPKFQRCSFCGEPTGRCEEDSLYTRDGLGPLCELCIDYLEPIRYNNDLPD